MEITYSSTRADLWRCNLYVMFRRPQTALGNFAAPVIMAFWLLPVFRHLGVWAYPVSLLTMLAGWALLMGLLIQIMILKRLPTPTSQRLCTTLITPEFFRDTVPDKVMEYRWAQLTDIRLHRGDFYFWIGDTKGNYIPAGAFADPAEMQIFYDAAVSYWRSAKAGYVAAGPLQSAPAQPSGEVWPPPPRF